MSRFVITRWIALCAALAGAATASASSFSYDVDVTSDGYRLNAEMSFSPAVGLGQIVHGIRNPRLLSELNPTMEPGKLIEKGQGHSDSILAFKVLGIHFEMLSQCEEKYSPDGLQWERRCILDPNALDASKFMISKSEEIHCARSNSKLAAPTACQIKVVGSLKKIPLVNPGKLNVKAKVQSLLNWGKFWNFIETGGISPSSANRIFERSKFKADIDQLLLDGLKQASASEHDFNLKRIGRFTVITRNATDIPRPTMSDPFQQELDRDTGTELTRNSELHLRQNGDALPATLQLIGNSRKFVLLQVLSLVCDSSTEPLIQALESKAKSGVDVRIFTNKMYARLDSGCLTRLEKSGVAIATGAAHASYYVNEQSELLIGSESIARMFFESNGSNSLDRDMMLQAKGPVATDALRDFLSVWEENAPKDAPDISDLSEFYRTRRIEELHQGTRGGTGNCRFASQKPDGRERAMETLLRDWIRTAKDQIFFSGVKMDPTSPWVLEARARAESGVNVDYLGNGWSGGNGELTMLLSEWVARWEKAPLGGFGLAHILTRLRDWDRDRLLKTNQISVKAVAGPPTFQFSAYSGFAHYKAWSVDQSGVWLGSANPDLDSISHGYEAGVLCFDPALVREFQVEVRNDLAHSTPF